MVKKVNRIASDQPATSVNNDEGKSHLVRIDILRGFAILLVFLYHSQLCLFPDFEIRDYNTNNHFIKVSGLKNFILNFSPTAFGGIGVHLFLLISGFLIHLGFLRNNRKLNISLFYGKRFWRIYPPYIFVVLFFCLCRNGISYYFNSKTGILDLLSHIFLIHNWWEKTIFTINPSFWSLALEMQLYIIYPLFLKLRTKFGIRRAFISILLLSLFLSFMGLIFSNLGNSFSYSTSVLKYWVIWCLGAVLAEKYCQGQRIFQKGVLPIAILGFIATMISKLYLYTQYFSVYIVILAWVAFFEWFLTTKTINIQNAFFRLTSKIGICSYGIYLIHQPYLNDVLKYFDIFYYSRYAKYFTLLKVIPTFLIIFFISYSFYLFIELRSIAFGKKSTDSYQL